MVLCLFLEKDFCFSFSVGKSGVLIFSREGAQDFGGNKRTYYCTIKNSK